MKIRTFAPADTEAVVRLWQRCGLVRPVNDPHKDIIRKLRERPELFLVGVVEGQVVASVMAGYEGHRGWLNYVAVDPDLQRHGLAREIVREAEVQLRGLGCPKINLQVRTSNDGALAFWKRMGYAVDDVVSLGRRLESDSPA